MKKVLFLPFLQIKTGHHHVAEALSEEIIQNDPDIQCNTREILNDRFGNLELVVSKTYLQWIHHFPKSYNWIYKKVVRNEKEKDSRYYLYELMFLNKMKNIIDEEQPDLIVCTHALPSYMLNRLKSANKINVPIVNVYTDYFVHNLWGTQNIDYHFISTPNMKNFLIQKGVKETNIFLTGIPISHNIKKVNRKFLLQDSYNVLIAGGSLGVGFCEEIVDKLKDKRIKYYFLCGKNENLYNRLKQLKRENVVPISYVHSKIEMNHLYDHMDAIITKPGGVTISECLQKSLPIFVYDALPGQEKVNLNELNQLGLINYSFEWKFKNNLEMDLLEFLTDEQKMEQYYWKIEKYKNKLMKECPTTLLLQIL